MKRTYAGILLMLVLVLGTVARCFAISDRPIWFDESFSWGMTQFPLGELLSRVAQDVHPPLYYLVLKGWMAVWGSSAVAMRSLSVMWGALSILGIYLFIVEAMNSTGGEIEQHRSDARGLAVLTAALVATSAFQVRYAWEVRMYAQGAALASLSHWSLFRALRGGAQPGWWFTWSLLSAAFAYTHYFAFFSLAAQGVFVGAYLLWPRGLRSAGTRPLITALAAGLLIVLLYLPWVQPFLRQRAEVQDSFWAWPVNRWTVPTTVYQMLIGGPSTDTFDRGLEHEAMAICASVVALGLTIQLFVGSVGERYLVLSFVLPLVSAVTVSVVTGRSIYTNRYFCFAHLSLLAALATWVWRIPWKRLRASVAVGSVAANAAICVLFIDRLDIPNRPGSRGAAELLNSRCAADELVVVANSRVFFPLVYYSTGRFEPLLLFEPHGIEHFGGKALLDQRRLITVASFWATRAGQVWVVHSGGFGGQTAPVPADWVPAEIWVFPELYWWQGEIIVTRYTLARRDFD